MSDWSMKCNYCHTSKQNLRRCTGCFTVYYCSRACQRLDWSVHRKACKTTTNPKQKTDFAQRKGQVETFSHNLKGMGTRSHDIIDSTHSRKNVNPNVTKLTTEECEEVANTNILQGQTAEKGDDADVVGKTKPTPKAMGGRDAIPGECRTCQDIGCTLYCARCRTAFYCSKECQKKDWSQHKQSCRKVNPTKTEHAAELTDEETRILEIRQMQHNKKVEERRDYYKLQLFHSMLGISSIGINVKDFAGSVEQYHQVLTPAQMAVFEKRPQGSLDNAVHYIQERLPAWNVIKKFNEIPTEYNFLYATFRREMKTVLVAFMFMYHTYPMRHGVYLKDARGKIMHVEFYFDHLNDDPRPYFTYNQVRPGDYIFIKNPVQHRFGDGVIGFRINHPSEVLFASCDSLQRHCLDLDLVP